MSHEPALPAAFEPLFASLEEITYTGPGPRFHGCFGCGRDHEIGLRVRNFRGEGEVLSPIVIPAIVLGIGLLMFCNLIGIGQGLAALLLGHFVLTLPYVVRTLISSFSLFDVVLEEAAQSLRASRLVIWYRVILPNILPGLLSAAIFSFVTSFGNVALSIFLVSGSTATLPVQMFASVEHSSDPTLAAVASFVIFITGIIVLGIDRLAGLQRLV